MKTGTHNLGRNRFNQLGLAKVEEGELILLVGPTRIVLSHEQAQLLKDVLA